LSKAILEKIAEVFQPPVPLWACEITSKHVIVAGVNKHRSQVQAKMAVHLPAGSVCGSLSGDNIQNVEAARSTLKKALSDAAFQDSEITVIVPDDAARIAFLTVEQLSKNSDEQQTFIRWKLKKTVPFDVDAAQVAYRVLGPHHGGIEMLVSLSPRSVIQEYEDLFDSLDLHAGLVMPSTLAALNVLNAPAGDMLFLKIAPDCITTTVFQDAHMRFYRRVTDVVSLYDAVYPTVMYYQDKLGGYGFQHLFVCGYDSDIRPLVAEIQEKLGLFAQRLEPRSVDDIFKPALGAAHLSHPEGVL
jgi:type IV pilus assembly protein PilM